MTGNHGTEEWMWGGQGMHQQAFAWPYTVSRAWASVASYQDEGQGVLLGHALH